jgi:hypothetical protein
VDRQTQTGRFKQTDLTRQTYTGRPRSGVDADVLGAKVQSQAARHLENGSLAGVVGNKQTERQTDRQTERQTDRQTDRETDRQRDRETERQTESPTWAEGVDADVLGAKVQSQAAGHLQDGSLAGVVGNKLWLCDERAHGGHQHNRPAAGLCKCGCVWVVVEWAGVEVCVCMCVRA